MSKTENGVRHFETGATRSAEGDKYDYEGFLSPLALERFGAYMHAHRKQPDGTVRDSDNWQKGIPVPQYVKSLWRHLVSTWKHFRLNWQTPAGLGPEIEDDLCAVIFNAQGMLHEILKARSGKVEEIRREKGYPATFPEANQLSPLLRIAGFRLTSEFRCPKAGDWFVSDPNLTPLNADAGLLAGLLLPPRWILKKI